MRIFSFYICFSLQAGTSSNAKAYCRDEHGTGVLQGENAIMHHMNANANYLDRESSLVEDYALDIVVVLKRQKKFVKNKNPQ